jgi:TonB-linked SusC/RagA family outer membrane protein
LWDFRKDEIARESNQTVITLGESNNTSRNLTSYTTLNYEKEMGDHFINVLAGHSLETFQSDNFSASIKDLYSTSTPILDAGTLEPNVGGSFSEWVLMSFFGRINYDFQDKYLLEANLRYDGSSRFSEENRWGIFPSFSAGWRLTEESFFPELSFISDIKIRASWGMLGNQNIGNYPYQAVYSLEPKYSFNGQLQAGAAQIALANKDIKWETTATTNVGIDFSLFENRLQGSFDVFNKLTDDILVTLPIALTYGDKTPPVQNVATVENKGWEAVLSFQQNIGDFRFGISGNFTQIRNEVVKYKGEVPSIDGVFIIREGEPIYSIYAYKEMGIFQTDEEVSNWAKQDENLTAPGDLKYEDFDGNGVINGDDRQIVGNTVPQYYYGVNLDFGWRGFDFSALFQGIADVDRYLTGQFVHPFATNDRTLTPTDWLDRWTPENTDATMPRVIIGGDYGWNYVGSTFWMQDGSFLRLKNLQIGYTVPSSLTTRIGISQLRIYGNGQNLFTLTDYSGYDPETTQTGQLVGYPNTKILSVGLQVTF